jgi:hypothetical protein
MSLWVEAEKIIDLFDKIDKEIYSELELFIERESLSNNPIKTDENNTEFLKKQIEVLTKESSESESFKSSKKKLLLFLKEEKNSKKEETKTTMLTKKVEKVEESQKSKKFMELNPFTQTEFFDKMENGRRINQHMSEVDLTIPVYSTVDLCGLLVESFRKIETLRSESDLNIRKKKKTEDVFQIFEALTENQSKGLSMEQVVDQKLTQTLDSFVTEFGGFSFIAPLDIVENQTLGAKNKNKERDIDNLSFIRYYWSSNMGKVREHMKSKGFSNQPDLQKAKSFLHCVLSRRVNLMFGKELQEILPKDHFPVSHLILVPVVVNKQTVALVGLANGSYTKQDSEIMYEVLPRMWTTVILESVAKSEKERQSDMKLKEMARQVEEGKEILTQLSKVMRDDTSEVILV